MVGGVAKSNAAEAKEKKSTNGATAGKPKSVVRLLVTETKLLLQRGHLPPQRRKLFWDSLRELYPDLSWGQIKQLERPYYERHQFNEPAYVALLSMLYGEIPPISPENLEEYLLTDGACSSHTEKTPQPSSVEHMQAFMDRQLEALQEHAHEMSGKNKDHSGDQRASEHVCSRCEGTAFDIVERQNRAADEAGAQSYVCRDCGTLIEIQR